MSIFGKIQLLQFLGKKKNRQVGPRGLVVFTLTLQPGYPQFKCRNISIILLKESCIIITLRNC